MDGNFKAVKPIKGPKVLLQLSWGCLIFFLVMYFGTYLIGSYFGAKIKARVEGQNAAANRRADAAKSQSPAGVSGPITPSNSAPSQ